MVRWIGDDVHKWTNEFHVLDCDSVTALLELQGECAYSRRQTEEKGCNVFHVSWNLETIKRRKEWLSVEARCEEGPGIVVNTDLDICGDGSLHFTDKPRVPSEPRPGLFVDVDFKILISSVNIAYIAGCGNARTITSSNRLSSLVVHGNNLSRKTW